jgi:NADH dehydrogenase FAD-containing subunit
MCSAAHLLSSSVAPLSPKFLKQLYETLEQRNIKLIRGEKVVQPSDVDFGTKKYERGPITVKTSGEKNMEVTTDLLIWAATWAINASIYPEEWLNELGELSIRPTFQIIGEDNVFAVGDVCSLAETKQAITLPSKMKLIRNNIVKVAESMTNGKFDQGIIKGLKDYKTTDKVTSEFPNHT